jgi:hypothetical protein
VAAAVGRTQRQRIDDEKGFDARLDDEKAADFPKHSRFPLTLAYATIVPHAQSCAAQWLRAGQL